MRGPRLRLLAALFASLACPLAQPALAAKPANRFHPSLACSVPSFACSVAHHHRHRAHPPRAAAPRGQVGTASYYGWREHGRRMADGATFHALGDAAASPTLPLRSHARVVNLGNGRSARVTIEDRGPYVGGRILDVSLGTARRLGMERRGLARVRVEPL